MYDIEVRLDGRWKLWNRVCSLSMATAICNHQVKIHDFMSEHRVVDADGKVVYISMNCRHEGRRLRWQECGF